MATSPATKMTLGTQFFECRPSTQHSIEPDRPANPAGRFHLRLHALLITGAVQVFSNFWLL